MDAIPNVPHGYNETSTGYQFGTTEYSKSYIRPNTNYSKFPEPYSNFSKRHIFKNIVIFPMSERDRIFLLKRLLQTTKWKNTKINCEDYSKNSKIWRFSGAKAMLCNSCKSNNR